MSSLVLLTMFVMLGASVWVFAELVGRQTRHRQRLRIRQWAKSRQMRVFDPQSVDAPTALPPLADLGPKIISFIGGSTFALAQVWTDDSKSPSATAESGKSRWNILQAALPADWPPCALRPAAGTTSLIDRFALSSYPSLALDRRFMVFASESRYASAMVASGVLSRLPPEVGLLLHHRHLILDFSARHFDEIEFARMIELAGELIALLTPVRR